jgi:hypothetical protein
MKLRLTLVSFILLLMAMTSTGSILSSAKTNQSSPTQDTTDQSKLIYADFEKVENGRPVSNGGGMIQIFTGQESTPVKFKGLANASPGAPEVVRLKDNDANHLATFDFSLFGPNQWANVTLEVHGHADKNGQTVADDVSVYKNLSLQMYVTGVDYVRVEFISHGQGIMLDYGFPQLAVKLKPGLNTYLIPLKGLLQPGWVQTRVDTKEVMKKLTAVSISTYCEQCAPQKGTVVVDNLVFQK